MEREKLKRDDFNGSQNLSIHSNYSNETSYNLKLMSFEDSQVDGFVPFSSPSILFWHANRKAVGEQTMLNLQPANMSEIEIARGDVDAESSRLVQLPAENTLELINASDTAQKEKLVLNKSNLTLIQNQESKLFAPKFEEDLESITDISKLKDKSEVAENEKSRISSISNLIKLPKKLDFLAESDSISNPDETSSSKSAEIAEKKQELKLELLENVSIDLSDEQTQIEEDAEKTVNLSKSEEFAEYSDNRFQDIESEIDKQLYKLIDQRLEMIIKKKLELNFPSNAQKKQDKVEAKPIDISITSSSSSIDQLNGVHTEGGIFPIDSKNQIKSSKDIAQTPKESMPNKFDETRDLTNISNDSFENTIPLRNVSNQSKPLSEKNLKEILENCTSIEHLLKELNIKDARKADKENYSSEASTQTSFVAEHASNRVFTNLQNQHEQLEKQQKELEKQLRKEKLKQVIYFQKAQHENRVKQLEKLAERERSYAEKLRTMLNTPNDSSLLDKTEWQEVNANLTLIEQGLNQTDHLFNFLQEENTRRKSDFARRNVDKHRLKNVNNDIFYDSSQVDLSVASTIRSSSSSLANVEKKNSIANQMDNLNKLQSPANHQHLCSSSTSSITSSKKVFILKENESSKIDNKQQQTNDFDADEDGRIFFTLSSTQTHVEQAKRSLASTKANYSEFDSKRFCSNEHSKSSRMSEFNHMKKSCHSEPSVQQSVEWAKKQAASSVSALEKMSLQDAFKHFKKDLIARSEKRLQVIEERSQVRHEEAEYKRKQQELLDKELAERKKALRRPNSTNALCSYFELKTHERKRQMSAHEIKEMSRKNYEKLPEVKQKQMRQRLEQERLLNRIKYSIYKKSIQQHVLLKGPNFDMYYKALDD